MHLIYKTILFFENKLNFRLINGHVYTTDYFFKLGKRILQEQRKLDQYRELISRYPREGDCKKAQQNEGLFTEMIFRIGLNKQKKKKILDIGSRAGLFPFYCNYFGHQAIASDMKKIVSMTPTKEIIDLFNVKVIPLKIVPFEKLPAVNEPFDLITGFRTRFHSRYPFETGLVEEEHWTQEEWSFFLKDLSRNYLKEEGKIYFILNRLQEKGKGDSFPLEMRRFFKELGGKLKYNKLTFNNVQLREKLKGRE